MTARHGRLLIAVALLLAAVLRLARLGDTELRSDESALAWTAARAAMRGEIGTDGVASPFAASAQAFAFALAGPDEWLARLPAALCGLALVLVPLLVRDALGPLRTSALALLAAASPSFVAASRDGAGAAPALLAASLAVAGVVRWRGAGRTDARRARAWALVASAACGLLVTTGPVAWGLVPLVALAAGVSRPWAVARPCWEACAAALGLGALLPASAGLWAIPWTAGVSASLTAWLEGLRSSASTPAWLDLLRAHPLTALLALAGLVGAKAGRMFLLVAALAWGAFVSARGAGSTAALAATLAIAAAHGAAVLAGAGPRVRRLGLAAAGAACVVQLAVAARPALPRADAVPTPGLALLAADLETVAIARGREASELPVVVLDDPPRPELAWALRRFRLVRFASVRPASVEGGAPALVAWPGGAPAPPPPGYVGATYMSSRGTVNVWVPLGP